MDENRIKSLTDKALEQDVVWIHNELQERMSRYSDNLDMLQTAYEQKLLPQYPRGYTNTLYDMMLDKLQSLINALREIDDTRFNSDLDEFQSFINERRDANYPERFYIRMYRDNQQFSIINIKSGR